MGVMAGEKNGRHRGPEDEEDEGAETMTTVEEDLDQASPLPPLPPASNFGRSLRKVRKGDGFNETGRKSCSTACAGKLGALRNTSLIACFDGASTVSLAYLKRERGERQKALPPPPSSIFSKCHFASSSCYETQPTNFCPFSSLLICKPPHSSSSWHTAHSLCPILMPSTIGASKPNDHRRCSQNKNSGQT